MDASRIFVLFLTSVRDDTRKKEPRRFPGGVHLTNLDYSISDISQPPPAQQAPGQREPPPQQSSWLDEIDVALVSAINAAIIRKYFISSPVEVSELSATPPRAPSQAIGRINRAAAAQEVAPCERKRRPRSRKESAPWLSESTSVPQERKKELSSHMGSGSSRFFEIARLRNHRAHVSARLFPCNQKSACSSFVFSLQR